MSSTDCKFPPHHRLKTRAEFKAVLDRGRSRAGRSAVVYAHPSPADHHRLGMIVSRRVGKAVVRNRLKRIVREQFRQRRTTLNTTVPLDFVVIIKRRAIDMLGAMPADLLKTWAVITRQARG